jgi:glycosyltransferase involved in cell wall biosynthesis
MKLSVLICTYNRPALLAHCLEALVERTEEKPDQVVVVNGGDERTDEVIREFSVAGPRSAVSVHSVRTLNKNLAASRNVGLPYCTGDIIGMTDDDAQVFPDWVSQMKCLHAEHPGAGAVGGPVIAAETDSLVSRISDRVTFAKYSTGRTVRTMPGVNVSYKRVVVEQVGEQDENLFRGEDVDYNWRAQQFGWTIYYDPRVRVRHHHRQTLRAFLNQHYMYGRAYYLVRRKWPEMYCIYPHHLRRPKDLLKALNFFAGAIYEPVWCASQMEHIADRFPAVPILFLDALAWRAGMVRQKLMAKSLTGGD